MGGQRDSNPQPPGPQPGALTIGRWPPRISILPDFKLFSKNIVYFLYGWTRK